VTPRQKRLLIAAGVFLVLTLAWNLPIALHPGSEVLGGPADGTLSIRSSWILVYEGHTPFTATRDTFNGAPEGIPVANAIAWFEPLQPLCLFLLHYVFGWIAAWNLFLLAGFFLTGFVGFMLFDRLGFHPLVSFFGAYVLTFNPWMFERAYAGHAGFLHAWLFPALLLALLNLSRKRSARSAIWVGFFYGLTFLDASYFGLVATVLVVAYAVYELVRSRGLAERLYTLSLAAIGALVLLVLLTPGVVKYSLDHHVVSSTVGNAAIEAQRLGADFSEYFLWDYQHPVFGFITRGYAPARNFSEGTLFFGYTTILLAVFGLGLLWRRAAVVTDGPDRRRAVLFGAILVPVACWASLKSLFTIGSISVPSLSWFMTHFTTYFRVYARIGILVGLGLALLAAPALESLVRRGRRGQLLVVALTGLVAFELLAGPVHGWAATKVPAYDRWLEGQPKAITAHYPMPTDQPAALKLGSVEIYWQMFDHQPLYNLFGPGTGKTREDAIRILSRYVTDPQTPSILAAEHVHYVVIHDDYYAMEHQAPPQLSPTQFRLLKRFQGVRIYELLPSVQPADLTTLLNQQAVEIGLVQGLQTPSSTLDGFGGGSWRPFTTGATITFHNGDVNLKRLQLIAHFKSPTAGASVELVGPDGNVAGSAAIGTEDTQTTLGPFDIPQGSSTYSLRITGGRTAMLGTMLVQPVADFSTSLAAIG
jgi:hypothetical protein